MRAWPLVVLAACHVPAPPRPAPPPPPALDDAAARAARLGGDPERVVASLGPRAAQLDVDGLVELGRADAAAGHAAEATRVLRSAVQRAEAAAGQRGTWRWLDTPRDLVVRVAVSPNLAVVATADRSGWIRAWDLGSGTERWVAHVGWPNGLAISPDGRWLAAAGGNGPLWVWNLATGERVLSKDTVRAPLAFAPDGALIAGRNERDDGLVRVALPAGTVVPIPGTSEFPDNLAVTRTLVISTDEPRPKRTEEIIVRTLGGAERARFLAAAFTWDAQASDAGDIAVRIDGRIQLFDVRGTLRRELPGGVFAMGRDGRRLVVEDQGALVVYDVASGAKLRAIAIGAGGALALRGDLAVVAGPDGIAVWNIETGRQTARLGRAAGAEAVAFDPSGAHLAVGNASGEASVWDLSTGALATIVPRAGLPVTSLAFDASGALAIGSRPGDVGLLGYEGGAPRPDDSIAGVWDLATRAPRWTRDADQLAWLAFQPGTGELAADAMLSTGNAGSVGVELIGHDGTAARTLAANTQALAWTPDGKALVEQLENGTIAVAPLDGGAAVAFAHEASVAAFAPDGATLAFGDGKGRVSLWDVQAAAPRLAFVDDDGPIADLAWSPDGAIVATAAGHAVRLWDRHGARLATLEAGAPIAAIAYRPDGRLVAAARVDGPVELWAVATGARVATLVAPGGGRGLVLGPDGAVDGELHDDDPLAWQVGARALPARGAWTPSPGLLARLIARIPPDAAPRSGLAGAAPPTAPPACYTPAPDEQREVIDPHPDGDGLALCLQSVRYAREPSASPLPACFHVNLATGAWTPRAPTPRQILGDADPATGAATVHVEGDRASVCRAGACTTVLLPAGISQPDRDVQVDDAGTLLAALTDRAIVTYDVATGRRRARIRQRRDDGTDVAIELLGHAVMVTTTPCAGPCSSSALYDGATGRLVAAVGGRGGMDTSYTTPAHVAGDVWAFNDGNASVIYQNVRTGRVLARSALPPDDCGPDGCDPTRLVHAGTGVVALGGRGTLHVLDRGGRLVATYTIPTCAPQ